jgi:major membrane immunogen (membrane-anchored lipoprotein)
MTCWNEGATVPALVRGETAMRSLTKILLSALLLTGCATMDKGIGSASLLPWWSKADITESTRQADYDECRERKGYGWFAVSWLINVDGSIMMHCMQNKGYKYIPLGPDGKPWKP